MTNSKNTKRALFTSVVAILLCCTMLLGTTFAWFTDTATSSNNRIQAGTLDIDLLVYDENSSATDKFVSVADSTEPIFDYALWEPGYTQVETMKIVNNGTLALKYQMNVVASDFDSNGIANLADVIDVYMAFDKKTPDNFADITEANGWWKCGTLTEMMTNPDGFTQGVLLPEDKETPTNNGKLLIDDTTNLAYGAVNYSTASIALHMQETAGNEYQGLSLGEVDIRLMATQWSYEEDIFGSNYDENAEYAATTMVSANVEVTTTTDADTGETTMTTSADVTLSDENASATVPEGTLVEDDTLALSITPAEAYSGGSITIEAGNTTKAFDVDVIGVADDNDKKITVVLKGAYALPTGLSQVALYHDGDAVSSNAFTYNPLTGEVTFKVNSFSNFTFVYPESKLTAKVTLLNDKDINVTRGINGKVEEMTLDTAYQFEPNETKEQGATSAFKNWHADFVVSADKAVAADSIALAGYYDAWCKFNNDNWVALVNEGTTIDANQEIRLVELLGATVSYEELCEYGNDGIGFRCGAKDLTGENKGTTLTVELRLYETDRTSGTYGSFDSETGEYITVGTFTYTF